MVLFRRLRRFGGKGWFDWTDPVGFSNRKGRLDGKDFPLAIAEIDRSQVRFG